MPYAELYINGIKFYVYMLSTAIYLQPY